MIDTTIDQSKICAPSAAYILGQVTSDLKAFNKLESSDIVRSLFGVEAANPNAMDITEALVASIAPEDQYKIRSLLQDRGISGVIWRFVTTKKFMVELSKAISSHGNFLSMSLITVNGDDGMSTAVRELVRFNKDKTEFLDKRMRSVEYNVDTVDTLMSLQNEAVANLKKKYLEPAEPPKPIEEPPAPPPPPQDICHFDVTGLESFGDKEPELCSKIWDPLGQLIESGSTMESDVVKWLIENDPIKVDGKTTYYFVDREDDDSKYGLYKIRVQISDKKPKTVRLSEVEPYGISFREWNSWDDLINAMDADAANEVNDRTIVKVDNQYYAYFNGAYVLVDPADTSKIDSAFEMHTKELEKPVEPEPPAEPGIVFDITATFESINTIKKDRILHAIHNELDNLTATELNKDDRVFNAILKTIAQELGEEASHSFEWSYKYDTEAKTLLIEEIIKEPPVEVKPAGEVKTDVETAAQEGFDTDGDWVKEDPTAPNEPVTVTPIPESDPRFLPDADPDDYQEEAAVPPPEESTPSVTEEEQPKKEEVNMPTYKIEVAESLKDIEETIKVELTKLLNDGCDVCADLTNELRKITEIDNILVTANHNVYEVLDPQLPEPPPEPEVPGADIHDREVQEGLLRGLFGTTAPAITHVQTFLRRHLKEIQNPTYLATETFPTEVMQVWDTKPYNFTVSIVKFKDGRFYRIFLAVTNPGLTDPTWLATNDIPGRWVQIGSDISESTFRPNFDRPRRRY